MTIRLVHLLALIFAVPVWAQTHGHDHHHGPALETIAPGLWRAVVAVPGGELPFHFDLNVKDGVPSAYLINGKERVRVDEVRLEEKSLTLLMSSFGSRITAVLKDGVLVGSLHMVRRGGRPYVMSLIARYDQKFRFFVEAEPPEMDVNGRWDVTFIDDEGRASKAVAELRQEGERVTGTFRTPTGDYRFLEGQAKGRFLCLSCFDGGHAFLFRATLGDDDRLDGDFWSGTWWHERWTARRDESVMLPDPERLTYLKEGHDRLHFRFPDLEGRNVSLSDQRFRDKVVVVTIAGSWCPNCHDEAAFLADFHRANQHRGFEVIGLMYEHYKDFDRAARQVRRFRERYDIKYTTLLAGYSDKTAAAATLPMLNHVLAFPTMIFIDRRGAVRRIHTGFDGPATGERFEDFKIEFTVFVDRLLNE